MVVQALRQTNSRSIEAAIEFISKMSYQDSRREQMAAAASRPLTAGPKPPGMHIHIYPWEGEMEFVCFQN